LANERSTSRPAPYKKIIIVVTIVLIATAAVSILLIREKNNNNYNNNNNPAVKSIEDSRNAAIENFQRQFCGIDTKANSNMYVNEFTLPQTCEMPLGIAVDNEGVWYISTKHGTLGLYNLNQNKVNKEISIPLWKARFNPIDSSQVWTVKEDAKGDIWFTDEKQNSIWRYIKSSDIFEMYNIPSKPAFFNTIYPVSLDFDSDGNVYFVGIRSTSLWFGNLTKIRNGTSEGISQIAMPIDQFKGIDHDLISTGSLVIDQKRKAVWISMLAFAKKGQILRYDMDTKTFKTFDMPEELNSPVGIAVDNQGNLWITDHGTSIFYKLDSSTDKITKFVTSKASTRIFGGNTAPEGAYTLPYWIQEGPDGLLWFNEHTGNKIAKFDPVNMSLIEYWIPTQNKLFGQCPNDNKISCGIANALQFSVGLNNQVWFTEWTENKIGMIDSQKQLPFSVSTSTQQLTMKKGKTAEVKVIVTAASSDVKINMIASGTFDPAGSLGNSTGSFSEQSFLIKGGNSKQVSFIFTPAADLKPGEYMLMIGGENDVVSYLKAVRVSIL
jgi:virginiamycin B lyase